MTQQTIFSVSASPAPGVAVTMSSREIAELTGKRHDHVMRDIRAILVELHGEGGVPKFGDTYLNEQNGQSYPVFHLPKRETLILVSGYSVELRARIIDRWQELEAAVSAPVAVVPQPPAFIETLAAAVDRGLLSRRSAVARLDALMGITLPRRAPRVVAPPVATEKCAAVEQAVDEFDQRHVAQVTLAAGVGHYTEFEEVFYADRPPLRAGDMLYAKRISRKPVTVCEQLIASENEVSQ